MQEKIINSPPKLFDLLHSEKYAIFKQKKCKQTKLFYTNIDLFYLLFNIQFCCSKA